MMVTSFLTWGEQGWVTPKTEAAVGKDKRRQQCDGIRAAGTREKRDRTEEGGWDRARAHPLLREDDIYLATIAHLFLVELTGALVHVNLCHLAAQVGVPPTDT